MILRSMIVVVIVVFAAASSAQKPGFLREQNAASRVKNARERWDKDLKARFAELGLRYPAGQVLLRSFKHEAELEVWAGDSPKGALTLVETIPICANSGLLGPKRQQGDLQVPEGFYVVDRFNAWSSYHLSLGVNYPNQSDRILGKKPLGGDIFIHGDCVTIGCIPLEDEAIERVYLIALDSYAHHKRAVHVHLFPARFNDDGRALLRGRALDKTALDFWNGLEPGYRAFEQNRKLPRVSVDKRGAYVIRTD